MKAYRLAIASFSGTLIFLGLAMIVATLWRGGGGIGLLIGPLFILAGAGRLYIALRHERR